MPAPEPARISPATSGAIAMLTFWTVPEATFAAVNSFGVLASDGRMELWAGRVSVTETEVSVASAYTTGDGAFAKSAIAAADITSACATYAASSIRSRRNRAPTEATIGATIAAGTSIVNATIPASVAPPRWNA